MGFTTQIMSQWGDKTATPELRLRLMKAGNNWLSRKSESTAKALDNNEITQDEASNQLSNLTDFMHYQIDFALAGRSNGGPAYSGPPSKRPTASKKNKRKPMQ